MTADARRRAEEWGLRAACIYHNNPLFSSLNDRWVQIGEMVADAVGQAREGTLVLDGKDIHAWARENAQQAEEIARLNREHDNYVLGEGERMARLTNAVENWKETAQALTEMNARLRAALQAEHSGHVAGCVGCEALRAGEESE
jgi:hypothetical protein